MRHASRVTHGDTGRHAHVPHAHGAVGQRIVHTHIASAHTIHTPKTHAEDA